MSQDKINEIIRDTAYQVAQALKSENSGYAPEMRDQLKAIKLQLNAQDEMHKEQKTEIESLKINVEEMKDTLESWKFGSRVAFWSFAGLGGIITWALTVLGIHITIK